MSHAAELGPWLGRLPETNRRDREPDFELDPVRFELVTTLFERAGAFRVALAGAADQDARAIEASIWLEIWRVAVDHVSERVLAAIDGRLDRAARRSGAPERPRQAARPGHDERSAIRARLDAAGAVLEQEVARIESRPVHPAAVRALCAALEDAWDDLERTARAEVAAYDAVAGRLDAWRPPRAVWLALGIGLSALAVWLGLVIGGWVPRPAWLDGLVAWFWSIPWP